MSFRMTCPKCGTRNYSITRDLRTSTAKDPVSGLIYSCRCGKQMFGQQVVDEHDAQLKAVEASGGRVRSVASTAVNGAEKQKERLRKAFEYRREYVAKRRAEDVEREKVQKEEKDRAWRERISRGGGDADAAKGPTDVEGCAWHECDKNRRPRSKYCSRECSNKNARYRHKERRRSDDGAVA